MFVENVVLLGGGFLRLKNNMAKEVLIYVSCFWKTTVVSLQEFDKNTTILRCVSLCHWIPTPKQVKQYHFRVPCLFQPAMTVFFQSRLFFFRSGSSRGRLFRVMVPAPLLWS